MPYKPQTTAGLILELGTVYGCTMTAGSAALSTGVPVFSSSDVGRTITVIGAGVTTGDPFTAALLKSTIASYTDSAHVTLADNALNSVTPNNNLTVYRPLNIQADVLTRSPIAFDRVLSTGTATMTFSVWSSNGSVQPKEGQPVWLHHTTLGDLFGGYVSVSKVRNEPGSTGVETGCECIDWSGVLIRRLIGTYNSTYSAITLKALCEAIVYNHGGSEGFRVDAVTGPIISGASYDYSDSVADGLTDGCGKASVPTASYWWYVNAWKVISVVAQDTTSAPFQMRISDGSAQANWLAQIQVENTGEKRANRAYVTGKELQAQIAQTFLGDGTTRQFTLANNAGLIVGMDVRTNLLVYGTAQTFAPKGSVDITGTPIVAQWYWNVDGTGIEQDASGTVLTSLQGLHVDYQPSVDVAAFYQYGPGVDECAAVQGGRGYLEVTVDTTGTTGIQPEGTTAEIAQNLATTMSGIPSSIDRKSVV